MIVTKGKPTILEYPFDGQEGSIKVSAICRYRDGKVTNIDNGQITDSTTNELIANFSMMGDNVLNMSWRDYSKVTEATEAQKAFLNGVAAEFGKECATEEV